jgi:hypothetical protein
MWYDIDMNEPTLSETIRDLLLPSTDVKAEGFRILLSDAPQRWQSAVQTFGSRAVSDACAAELNALYRKAFSKPFLFSDRCLSFELHYHLNAYLWTIGRGKRRHITTFVIPRKRLERACRSIEIDTTDVYYAPQRLMFRYFFGIRAEYLRTVQDPYAIRLWGRFLRIPLLVWKAPTNETRKFQKIRN